METLAPDIWLFDSGSPGSTSCISFGVHGNERPPIEAGLELKRRLVEAGPPLTGGRLLLVHANPLASAQDRRWSEGGIDLNRCFHRSVLSREPENHEEERAREIVKALEETRPEILVDFHCTVEPGDPFLMQHAAIGDRAHRDVRELLRAEVVLADPELRFGGVSLDEWMSTRGKVGICYETGWIQDPANTPAFVMEEMLNVLAGQGLIEREVKPWRTETALQLFGSVPCRREGFSWADGIGVNLQSLEAGSVLGEYPGGEEVVLEESATLIFPKKRPELIQLGQALTLLARGVQGSRE